MYHFTIIQQYAHMINNTLRILKSGEQDERFYSQMWQTIASGQVWRGNFFKCAEDISHPHWAAWSPVDEFNFHLPRCFGTIQFA